MEKKMENEIEAEMIGLYGDIRVILGLYGDNGKANGNYYDGLCRLYG